MPTTGKALIDLVSHAEREVVLVAPFIKQPTLRRILNSVPQNVTMTCVTRWEPLEILAGVSDIEVWELLRTRPQASLHLRMSLHAKYYRSDQCVLVGSANLTDAALGWSQRANLELLIPISADEEDIVEFERELMNSSVVVDQSLYDATMLAVNKMREANIEFPAHASPSLTRSIAKNLDEWLPTCRTPDRLYDAYLGRDDRMLSSAFADARRDLMVLNPPASLNRSAFMAYVASLLDQHPLVRKIDCFVSTPRTAEEISDQLSHALGIPSSGTSIAETWYVLKIWMLTFFPDRYRIKPPHGTEIFVRGRRIA